MHAFLLFPNQLFEQPLPVPASTPIFLIENDLFFTQYRFHQQKIILHRSSMKYYQQRLEQQKHTVHYIEHHQPESRLPQLIRHLAAKKFYPSIAISPTITGCNNNWNMPANNTAYNFNTCQVRTSSTTCQEKQPNWANEDLSTKRASTSSNAKNTNCCSALSVNHWAVNGPTT